MKICSACKAEKDLSEFHKDKTKSDGYYSSCKECKESARDPYKRKLQNLAYTLLLRVNNSNRKEYRAYKGIECKIGKNTKEVREYLHENFERDIRYLLEEGQNPSLDRIDPKKHYEHGNLRIITFEDNCLLGLKNAHEKMQKPVIAIFPGGERMYFNSLSDASKDLGPSIAFISKKIINQKPVFNHKNLKNKKIAGVTFEYGPIKRIVSITDDTFDISGC